MKKSLLTIACVGAFIVGSSVQALDLTSSMSTIKKATTSSTTTTSNKTDTAAKEAVYQKQFKTTIASSEKTLASAKTLATNARWDLASILLDKDTLADFSKKKSEINANKDLSAIDKTKQLNALEDDLIKSMNKILASEDFDYVADVKQKNAEAKYINAVKNMQIATNRYDNITNNMSPNFNNILKGNVSVFALKTELKESGQLTLDVQSAKSDNTGLLRKLNKINDKNNVYVAIPDTEKVVYSKDGIIGGINYQINDINKSVQTAYGELINAFDLKNEIKKIEAEINNNPDISKEERDMRLKQARTTAITNELTEITEQMEIAKKEGKKVELTTAQQTAVSDATSKLITAGINYTSVGMTCASLGMKIYRNPLLAAALAPEVTQLKYTGKVLKEGASALKQVSTQTIKICKINNIKYEDATSKSSTAKK